MFLLWSGKRVLMANTLVLNASTTKGLLLYYCDSTESHRYGGAVELSAFCSLHVSATWKHCCSYFHGWMSHFPLPAVLRLMFLSWGWVAKIISPNTKFLPHGFKNTRRGYCCLGQRQHQSLITLTRCSFSNWQHWACGLKQITSKVNELSPLTSQPLHSIFLCIAW